MREQILDIFAQLMNVDVATLSGSTRLEEDLEMKSIHKFSLLAMLEGAFGSAPEPDVAEGYKTIQDFIDYYAA